MCSFSASLTFSKHPPEPSCYKARQAQHSPLVGTGPGVGLQQGVYLLSSHHRCTHALTPVPKGADSPHAVYLSLPRPSLLPPSCCQDRSPSTSAFCLFF